MNEELPEDKMRTAQEIARRALIVSVLTGVAYGDSREDVSQWLQAEGLWPDLSPRELAFLQSPHSSDADVIFFSWGVERLVPLLWSIKKITRLHPLTCQCDTEALKRAVVWPPEHSADFVESAELRSESEIKEEYEKVYDAHWRVRDAQLNRRPIPDGLNGEIVFERHYAFNWVIGYFGQEWDEISTDT